jgi:hypothetical protein
MVGILIIVIALVAALLWFIGMEEPRRRLRDAGFYLLVADLVIVGLVVANYVAGGRP